MEYTLLTIFYFIQSFFNLLMNLEVVPGVTVGGILIAVFVFGTVFASLGFFSDDEENPHQKSRDLHEDIRRRLNKK